MDVLRGWEIGSSVLFVDTKQRKRYFLVLNATIMRKRQKDLNQEVKYGRAVHK